MAAPRPAAQSTESAAEPPGARPLRTRRSAGAGPEPRLDRFLSELERMSSRERVGASRRTFSRWERSVWAARFPEEVPLVNGEFEWIAASLL